MNVRRRSRGTRRSDREVRGGRTPPSPAQRRSRGFPGRGRRERCPAGGAFVEPNDRYDEPVGSVRCAGGRCWRPDARSAVNTDEQVRFRSRWSSSTRSRVASERSRCHGHASRAATSSSPSGAAARAALIAWPPAARAWVIATSSRTRVRACSSLKRSRILRLSGLEQGKDVLGARCCPKSEKVTFASVWVPAAVLLVRSRPQLAPPHRRGHSGALGRRPAQRSSLSPRRSLSAVGAVNLHASNVGSAGSKKSVMLHSVTGSSGRRL